MLPRGFLHCFLAVMALCIIKSITTPVFSSLEADSPQCPRAWFQYDKFCLKRAPVGSERTVALYCDEMGGIGVSGLCVIKAGAAVVAMENFDLELPSEYSPLISSPEDDGAVAEVESDMNVRSEEESGVCPIGWAHYQSICVYKLWTRAPKCHQMGAVQLRGMCLRHAEQREASHANFMRGLVQDAESRETSHTNDTRGSAQEKRVCCCAHPKASSNNYGCK